MQVRRITRVYRDILTSSQLTARNKEREVSRRCAEREERLSRRSKRAYVCVYKIIPYNLQFRACVKWKVEKRCWHTELFTHHSLLHDLPISWCVGECVVTSWNRRLISMIRRKVKSKEWCRQLIYICVLHNSRVSAKKTKRFDPRDYFKVIFCS